MSDVQRVLDALTSPVRREILWRIWREEASAGDIAAAFHVTAPTISEHLAVLRAAGLVDQRREGTRRYYRARQDAVRGLLDGLTDEGSRWIPVENLPERELASARTVPAVVAGVDLPIGPQAAFAAFTDAREYSRWLGAPVTLEDGRFSCTLEWGIQVRGRYELVVPPSLIVMRWDFDDDRVPLPGAERTGYLRIEPRTAGCRVEVHQLVDTAGQAAYLTGAWTFVLGRLAQAHRT